MRVLRSIVLPQATWSMAISAAELTDCSAIGSQAVGDDRLRTHVLVFQQLPEELPGGTLVASRLDEHVEDFAFVIDGSPQVHPPPADPHHHLVEVPPAGRAGSGPAEVARKEGTELQGPAADGLVAHLDPAAAIRSSTSRKLRVKRKYNHTAWRMTSGGNRWRAKEMGFILPHYRLSLVTSMTDRSGLAGPRKPEAQVSLTMPFRRETWRSCGD
jgi:hypothetical protein